MSLLSSYRSLVRNYSYVLSNGSQKPQGTLDLHFVVPVLQRVDQQRKEIVVRADFSGVPVKVTYDLSDTTIRVEGTYSELLNFVSLAQ